MLTTLLVLAQGLGSRIKIWPPCRAEEPSQIAAQDVLFLLFGGPGMYRGGEALLEVVCVFASKTGQF